MQAAINLDRFHVTQILTDAVRAARSSEMQSPFRWLSGRRNNRMGKHPPLCYTFPFADNERYMSACALLQRSCLNPGQDGNADLAKSQIGANLAASFPCPSPNINRVLYLKTNLIQFSISALMENGISSLQ